MGPFDTPINMLRVQARISRLEKFTKNLCNRIKLNWAVHVGLNGDFFFTYLVGMLSAGNFISIKSYSRKI